MLSKICSKHYNKKTNLAYTKADGRDNTKKVKLTLYLNCGRSKDKKRKITETKSLSIWLLSL